MLNFFLRLSNYIVRQNDTNDVPLPEKWTKIAKCYFLIQIAPCPQTPIDISITIVYILATTLIGGEKMPPIFKTLASIGVWALWIFAWVTGLGTLVMGISRGTLFGAEHPPVSAWIGIAVGLFTMFLAIVAIKLRKEIE